MFKSNDDGRGVRFSLAETINLLIWIAAMLGVFYTTVGKLQSSMANVDKLVAVHEIEIRDLETRLSAMENLHPRSSGLQASPIPERNRP